MNYLRAAKARPEWAFIFAFFLAFLAYKVVAGELGGLAIMSAYFVGLFGEKLTAFAKGC